MTLMQEIVVSVFLILGGVFGLVGSWGLIRLSTPMARLHAPTKATTLGVGGVLIASMLYLWFNEGIVSFHELLVTLFLLLTAPITALFIAKTHLWGGDIRDTLPPTGTDADWATFPADGPTDGVKTPDRGP